MSYTYSYKANVHRNILDICKYYISTYFTMHRNRGDI